MADNTNLNYLIIAIWIPACLDQPFVGMLVLPYFDDWHTSNRTVDALERLEKKLHEFSWSNPCPWCQQPTVCFTTCLEVMECNMSIVMWLNQRHTVHGLQHTVISDVMMWLTGSSWSMHAWLQWQWNIAWWLCMFWFALLSWAQIYMHHMIMFFHLTYHYLAILLYKWQITNMYKQTVYSEVLAEVAICLVHHLQLPCLLWLTLLMMVLMFMDYQMGGKLFLCLLRVLYKKDPGSIWISQQNMAWCGYVTLLHWNIFHLFWKVTPR